MALIYAQIRLLDWPEGGYTVNDMPDPRGEILVSGNNVTLGYYKNKKATDESFIEIEGKRWFCTGAAILQYFTT